MNGDTEHQGHRLTVRNLHVHYGSVCALRDISFDVTCSSAVGLMGPNGSGKSTLLKCLAGLIPVSEGEITWRGESLSQGRTEFAYLPQMEEVDWDFPLTVRRLVAMGRFPQLGPWKRFRPEDDAVVDRCLEAMEITDLQNRNIRALSGGQQQRAFIARALAQEPHVLLLDEVFAGLDRQAEAILIGLLRKLSDSGHLILASHHDVRTAPEIFDHVLLLKTAQLTFGPTAEVLTEKRLVEAFA